MHSHLNIDIDGDKELTQNNSITYYFIDPAETYNSKVCIITTGTFKGRNESEQEFITRSAGIIRAIVTPVGTSIYISD